MKKKFYYIFIFILLILIIYNLFMFFSSKKSISTLKEQKKVIDDYDRVDYAKSESNDNVIDYLKDYYNNDNIVGVLSIKNLGLNAILTKYSDNSYYLKHDIRNNYDIYGNVFIDYRVNLDSRQVNIYGHSDNRQNVPFARLTSYLNYKTYLDNKYIDIDAGTWKKRYKVFSVGIVSNDNAIHMNLNYSSDSKWGNHFNDLKNLSIYKTGEDVSSSDNIIVLQTCLYGKYEGKYLIVCAKEV